MGAKPAPQQRPKPFHGVAMHLTVPIAILVTGIFTLTVVDRLVQIAPFGQFIINVVLVRVYGRPFGNRFLDDRADGLPLDVVNHFQAYLAAPCGQPQYGVLLIAACPAPPFAPQLSPAGLSLPFPYLWGLSFLPGNDITFIGLNFSAKRYIRLFFTTPSLILVHISCAVTSETPSSLAICELDTFRFIR